MKRSFTIGHLSVQDEPRNAPGGTETLGELDGMGDSGKALHALSGASHGLQCLFCGVVLEPSGRHRGSPQKFCRLKPCRRLFWRQARVEGGKALRRRLARQVKAEAPRPKRPVLRLPRAQYDALRTFVAVSAAWS